MCPIVCEVLTVVTRLGRTEEEIGVDDLKAVHIPTDVTERLQREAAAAVPHAPPLTQDTT